MRRRAGGHTLAELLVVLALAIVLAALAMPALHTLLARLRLRAAVADLCAAIDLTRSQALARGGMVLLVPADPAGVWQHGWLVFADRNHNRHPDPGETVFFRHGPLPDGIVVSMNFSTATTPPYLAYNGAGRGCDAANSLAARWGTLSLRQQLRQDSATRRIKIGMLGRLRVCDPEADGASCGAEADAP